MARDGIADLTYVNPGYQPGRFPIIAAGELPFLISDAKGGSAGLDAWYRKYAANEMKDVKFCLAFIHAPSSFHSSTKKIVVPDDIKGMKVRPADATMANLVTLLGGTNVQSSAPEVRDIIERHVADAVTFPVGIAGAVRHRQGHEVPHGCAALRDDFRPRLQQGQIRPDVAAQKKAIDDNCTNDAAGRVGGPWGEFEDAGLGKVKAEAGQEVYQLTPEQTAAWKKAAEPLVKSWADGVKKAGVDPDAAMKELARRPRQIQRARELKAAPSAV